MARKAAKKRDTQDTERPMQETSSTPEKAAATAKPKARRKRAKRKAASPHRAPSRPKSKRKTARRAHQRRVRYSDTERAKILATAEREGLTGAQVRERFGVSTLTYYTCRKKAGSSPPRGQRGLPARQASGHLDGQIRAATRAQVRAMLPRIIDEEVGAVLGSRRR